jgi:hypothetical protein
VLAVDFLHVDTLFLTRIYALIAVEHGSRRTHLIGLSTHTTGAWTTQAARNLMTDLGERVTTVKFLLCDRDSRFTGAFDAVFAAEGIRDVGNHSVGQGHRWYDFGGLPEPVLHDMIDHGMRHNPEWPGTTHAKLGWGATAFRYPHPSN